MNGFIAYLLDLLCTETPLVYRLIEANGVIIPISTISGRRPKRLHMNRGTRLDVMAPGIASDLSSHRQAVRHE